MTSSTTSAQTPNSGATAGSTECAEALTEAAKLIARAEKNAREQQAAKETAERRRDEVIREKEEVERERDEARGDVRRLEYLVAQKDRRIVELLTTEPRPMPWYLGAALHAIEVLGAVAGTACLLTDCSTSTTITSFAISAGALTLDVSGVFGAFD